MPWSQAIKDATEVSVRVGGVATNTFTNSLAADAPGIFVTNAANQAAAVNQDGTPNSPSNPAAPGSIIAIYGTGGGPTNPAGQTGALSPLIQAPLTLSVTVQIDAQNAQVMYAGAAPGLISGVFQINILIPDTMPPGTAYLSVTIESIASPTAPTIAVQ